MVGSSTIMQKSIIQQLFRISQVSLIAHVPGNPFFLLFIRQQALKTCPYSSHHELYYCCCVPGRRDRMIEPAVALCFLFFGGNSQSWLLLCTINNAMMFCISASLIGNRIGIVFFATQSDLINIRLFIGNRFFLSLSDRNRLSSRYATLLAAAAMLDASLPSSSPRHQQF